MAGQSLLEQQSEVFCAIGDQSGGFRELMVSSNEGGLFFFLVRSWGASRPSKSALPAVLPTQLACFRR
jgi:hypothetical protein